MQLPSIDRVDQGVMPSYAGEKIFLRLGYEKVDTLHVPGDENGQGFDIAVALYRIEK
jgi:hypothetical protein